MFEVPPDELEEAAAAVKEAMEKAVRLDVPVVVDMKKGVNWSEMEKI